MINEALWTFLEESRTFRGGWGSPNRELTFFAVFSSDVEDVAVLRFRNVSGFHRPLVLRVECDC